LVYRFHLLLIFRFSYRQRFRYFFVVGNFLFRFRWRKWH